MHLTQNIGNRLKQLRLAHGWSINALAQHTGIAKSTLSTLEAGKGNPTIETLWTLANALGVRFSDLAVNPDHEPSPTLVEPGGARVRLVERSAGEPRIEVYVMSLAGMEMKRSRAHPPGVIERVLVVSGVVHLGREDDLAVCRPGEHHMFAADVAHRYEALVGEAKLIVMVHYPQHTGKLP
ncbi:XRE family transcriptional regulator [Halomonas shantousis]